MTDLPTLMRGSRSARAAFLAFGALCLMLLPARTASAQLPPVDGCVANPASCLPDTNVTPLPEIDPCTADPASCLPSVPPVDGCAKDPASCLPPVPSVDECAKDPASCVSPAPSVDRCLEDPKGCAQEEIDRCVGEVTRCLQRDNPDPGDGDEEEGGAAAPPNGSEPPRHSADATGPAGGQSPTAASSGPSLPSSEGTEIGTAEFATATAGTTLEQIEGGLADAAQRFAFPLAVAGLVGAFLLFQGRIDRRDPKLAVAPIDAHDDLVVFE